MRSRETVAKKVEKNKCALLIQKGYEGKYIALTASNGGEVVASGRNAGTVIRKARKLGVDVPAIVFVPKKDVAYAY